MMKAAFTKGEGHIGIKYDTEPAPEHLAEKCPNGLRTTTLTVQLPSGETLTSKVKAHSSDQFVKREGRFYAFLKLIEADNDQAVNKALEAFQSEVLKQPETEEGLSQAAKAYYKLSREDRRYLFGITCPEFFRNTPERRKQRELSLLAYLRKKYRKKRTPKVKVITENTDQLELSVNTAQVENSVNVSRLGRYLPHNEDGSLKTVPVPPGEYRHRLLGGQPAQEDDVMSNFGSVLTESKPLQMAAK